MLCLHRVCAGLAALYLCLGTSPAGEAPLQQGWGYRNDGSGIFPDDCTPVTTWKEYAGTVDVVIGRDKPAPSPDPKSQVVMQNIVWRTPLPNMGEGSPICVGTRVFTLCEPGWPVDQEAPSLVCVDGEGGKILWQQPVDHFDTLPQAQQVEAKRLRSLYWNRHRQMRALQMRVNEAHAKSDMAAYDRLTEEIEKAGFKELAGKLSEKKKGCGLFAGQSLWGAEGEVRPLVATYRFTAPGWAYGTVGMTFATPCTDGRLIYVTTGYGAVAAFDLQGKLRWMNWLFDPKANRAQMTLNSCETASSPIVVNGRVLWHAYGWMFGLDAETGKVAWEYQSDKNALKEICDVAARVGTPIALRVGTTDIVVFNRGFAFRIADGKPLGTPVVRELWGMGHQTYVFDREQNLLYFGTGTHGTTKIFGQTNHALKLTMETPESLTATFVWQLPQTQKPHVHMGDDTGVFHRGSIYMSSGVFEATSGAIRKRHSVTSRTHGLLVAGGRVWSGLCGGATKTESAAITDDGTLGPVVVNHLGHLGPFEDAQQKEKMRAYGSEWIGEWYSWAIGRGYPFFSGNRIFYRTFDHLYCIGEKDKPFTPSKAFLPR